MKVIIFVAQSLDGYIAKKEGDIEWLNRLSEKAQGEDHGYESLMQMADCLIMGRKSFEKVLSFDFWPYEGERVIVLSHTLKEVPEYLKKSVTIYAGSIDDLVKSLEDEGLSTLYIDGAHTIQSFLTLGYVTTLTITTVPILLGEGISLFGYLPKEVELAHEKSTAFPSGMVQSTYSIT